jgi:hypothetical protein
MSKGCWVVGSATLRKLPGFSTLQKRRKGAQRTSAKASRCTASFTYPRGAHYGHKGRHGRVRGVSEGGCPAALSCRNGWAQLL